MMPLHNAHVLKRIRWEHWLAERDGRYFAMLFWCHLYEVEQQRERIFIHPRRIGKQWLYQLTQKPLPILHPFEKPGGVAPPDRAKGAGEPLVLAALRRLVAIADEHPFAPLGHVIEHQVPLLRALLAALPSTIDQAEPECSVCGGTGDVSGEYPGVACQVCSGSGQAQPPAHDQARRDAVDAGRYRFLRDPVNQADDIEGPGGTIIVQAGYLGDETILAGDELDAAIDTAQAASAAEGQP